MSENPIKTWRHFFIVWRAMPVRTTLQIVWKLPTYLLAFIQGFYEGAARAISRK